MIRNYKLWSLMAVAIMFISVSTTVFAQEGTSEAATPAEKAPAAEPVVETPKVDLAAKLPVGKWILDYTHHRTTSNTTIDGVVEPDQKIKMNMILGLSIAKPDSKGRTGVMVSFKELVISIKKGQNKEIFDSSTGGMENRFLADLFVPLMKVVITAQLDSAGKCVSLKGLDKLWADVAKGNPRVKPMLTSIEQSLGDVLSSAGSGQLMPTKPVGLGEKWTSTVKGRNAGIAGQVSGKFDCLLKSVEQTKAGLQGRITFTGKYDLADKSGSLVTLAKGATMKIEDVTSDLEGTMDMYIDKQLAYKYSCSQASKINMLITRKVDRENIEKRVRVSRLTETKWTLSEKKKPAVKPDTAKTDKTK